MGDLLILVGICIGSFAGLWMLFEAFKESILWGLACLFLPFAGLLFLVLHWQVAKAPFLLGLLAIPFYVVGGGLIS
ncbi:MAG: hypothetical protein NE334_14150 [Lentisphaeraceae bacterium]|nr:hypothetical protein [Lentisphaeraceae bacterium]